MSTVGIGPVPKSSALEPSRREHPGDVSFRTGTLLVIEQSSLENPPGGCDIHGHIRYICVCFCALGCGAYNSSTCWWCARDDDGLAYWWPDKTVQIIMLLVIKINIVMKQTFSQYYNFSFFQNNIRVSAVDQFLLGGKTCKYILKPTNYPTQGQPNPRKNRWKVAFGPLFPTTMIFSWVGIGFI